MNSFSRGVKNAFRNGVRTVAVCLILALVIGLTLAMLVANSAVNERIGQIKAGIGNNITISAGGMRGFGGGMMGGFGNSKSDRSGTPGDLPSDDKSNSDNTSSGNTLTNDDVATVKKTSHVTSVMASLSAQVSSADTDLKGLSMGARPGDASNTSSTSSNSSDSDSTTERTMPLSAMGVTSVKVASTLGDIKLSDGSNPDYSSDNKEVVIGDQLAKKNSLKVGSTFTMYDQKFTVKGIIQSGSDSGDSSESKDKGPGRSMSLGSAIIIPLATLQNLNDNKGKVTTITATVDNVDNTDSTVTAIEKALGTDSEGNNAADVTSDKESADAAIKSLSGIKDISLICLIVCAIIAAVVIFLAMLMVVRERRNEIGIMKAIGAKSQVIIKQFMAESLVITVLASIIGLGMGVAVATPITNVLTESSGSQSSEETPSEPGDQSNSETKELSSQSKKRPSARPDSMMNNGAERIGAVVAKVDWTIVLYALGSAVVIAALGATAASFAAMKIKPAEAVRAE